MATSEIILKEKASHWYRYDPETGNVLAWYEVPNKSKPGEMRPTTLKDARKMPGSMVSVGSILDVKSKPRLTSWKIKQALMAAMTTPRDQDETDEVYVERVLKAMDEEGATARGIGIQVHDIVESYLKAKKDGVPQEGVPEAAYPLAVPAMEWIDEHVTKIHSVEKIVGNPLLGYGGRMDLDCELGGINRAIVDFKTQRMRKNSKGIYVPTWYWEYGVQLAAYKGAASVPDNTSLVSVAINSEEPSEVHVHVWDDPDKRWRMFRYLLEIWQDDEGFIPGMKIGGEQ